MGARGKGPSYEIFEGALVLRFCGLDASGVALWEFKFRIE